LAIVRIDERTADDIVSLTIYADRSSVRL